MNKEMERTIVLRVLTRCSNMDQFVATFRRFSADNAVFVPTTNQCDVGAQTEFAIRLVDGAIALAGTGEICERHATANNAFGKPGILIDIRELSGDTESVFERMRAAGPSTARLPDDEPDDVLKQAVDDEIDAAAITTPIEIYKPRPPVATTLGVAPLAPATFVTAPFVNDTPVPRWPRASRPDHAARMVASTAPQLAHASWDDRPERTAMVPLDRTSGEPRIGPWQAFVGTLARSVRGVRWWLRRKRSTEQLRTPTAS
jgi:hypothetical protein